MKIDIDALRGNSISRSLAAASLTTRKYAAPVAASGPLTSIESVVT
jgi:hypothetical protein